MQRIFILRYTSIIALKGTGTILAPYIRSNANPAGAASPETDAQVVRLFRELSEYAKKSDLQIAIYPHFGFYVQRTDHALKLVRQINRKNTGLSFNLCHWLATTPLDERGGLKVLLKNALPYLKMITICGANDVVTSNKNVWADYILPLGNGSFDTYGLVKYVIADLHFKGPVAVQCYGLKEEKRWLVEHSMDVWKSYGRRMASGRGTAKTGRQDHRSETKDNLLK
jgi:sugar phosphate isomerase/epimerase